MRWITAAALGCVLTTHGVLGGEEPAKFAAEPKVTAEKNGVKIEFAAGRATDVAVEVLDAKGETVRHLAAGVLGDNAPEPLAKGLAQSLLWDRKDDLGKDLPAGSYSVRVGLGLKPALKKVENFEPLHGFEVFGLAAMPEGGAGLFNTGAYGDYLPRLSVADRDVNYARQIFPPPASLDPEKSPGIAGFRRGDGRWVPLLGEVCPRPKDSPAFCPMAAGGGRLAVAPFSASAVRVFDAKTGALAAPVGGEAIGQGKGKLSPRGLAVSPDGQRLYLTGVEVDGKQTRPLHAVYRLPADGSAPPKPLLGEPDRADKSEALLNAPAGLAVDKDGNLLVCDSGNDRVAVFSADGKFLRAAEVRAPVLVQALPDGGCCALSAGAPPGAARTFPAAGMKLVRLAADGKQLAAEELKVPGNLRGPWVTGLAADTSREPAVAWVSLSGQAGWTNGGAVLRFECRGAGLAALAPVSTSFGKYQQKGPYDPRYVYNWGVSDGSYIKYQEAFDWNYLTDEGTPFYSCGPLDAKTGLWADGRRWGWNDWIWYDKKADPAFLRTDPGKTPLPFEATGTNALKPTYKPRAPWFAQRGCLVDRRGHVWMRYSWDNPEAKKQGLGERNEWVTGALHFDAEGRLAGELVLSHGTYGMGVDARGNIYVGDKPRPAGALVPQDVEKAFGGKVPESISGWYGAVVKFGPKGGGFLFKKGAPKDKEPRTAGDLFKPAPKSIDADFGCWITSPHSAELRGAEWMWVGTSPFVPQRACICYGTNLAVDPHGRVFAPDRIACRVAVLDAAGNLVRYIGSYGNMDSRGKDSPVPDPEIAFATLRMVTAATSRQVRVADNGNNWVSVISLDYEKEAKVPVTLP
jgi:hypothetical protein